MIGKTNNKVSQMKFHRKMDKILVIQIKENLHNYRDKKCIKENLMVPTVGTNMSNIV